MCGAERIVVAWPPGCFANGQSDQFTDVNFQEKKELKTVTP